jgi:hypothetical protein
MSVADELHKLKQLHETGAISDEEFATAKARVLDGSGAGQWGTSASGQVPRANIAASVEQDTRQWAMLLHFSMLLGFVVPLAGLIAPIVIWQVKKSELPEIDEHGKNAVNWIISGFIYALACIPLVFVLVGIPLLIVLGVLWIIFPIVAGVKASNGQAWEYPMAIRFL